MKPEASEILSWGPSPKVGVHLIVSKALGERGKGALGVSSDNWQATKWYVLSDPNDRKVHLFFMVLCKGLMDIMLGEKNQGGEVYVDASAFPRRGHMRTFTKQ